jgi:hypothetical protein
MRLTHKCFLLVFIANLWLLTAQNSQAFYSPSTGRWLSRDPIGQTGGRNLYAAAGNDLVNRQDYFGLMSSCGCCVEDLAIIGSQPFDYQNSLGTFMTGHKFTISIALSYQGCSTTPSTDCNLRWTETWDTPGFTPGGSPIVPGRPFNLYPDDSPRLSIFNGWNNRRKPCDQGEVSTITDVPVIARGWEDYRGQFVPQDNHRVLNWEISVESGSANCRQKSLTIRPRQVLEVKGGVVVSPPSGFFP